MAPRSQPTAPSDSPRIKLTGLPKDWRLMERQVLFSPPEEVAPQLLGKLLAHRTSAGWLAGRIVEVEAYLGPHITETPDPAAHSYRGVTPRNRVMFGQPGHAYVYFIYGMYYCVNVTCEPEGMAGCILIRALEPMLGREAMADKRGLGPNFSDAALTSGPGKLCQALDITRAADNGLDLLDAESPLQLLEDGFVAGEPDITTRIGIRHAQDLPLRFSITGNTNVSGRVSKRPPKKR